MNKKEKNTLASFAGLVTGTVLALIVKGFFYAIGAYLALTLLGVVL